MQIPEFNDIIERAAHLVRQADGLLITAGAGMGVDSNLPDFRGKEGLWKHYPALGNLQMGFMDIASPETFVNDPTLAWGFYGHRLQLYRQTEPHHGFQLLRQWASHCNQGAFVFTSNVDGQFQKAGFPEDRIVECHGSIHYLQCCRFCDEKIWPATQLQPQVDQTTCRCLSELPHCPSCGGMARPNILMFGDFHWIDQRQVLQFAEFDRWRRNVQQLLVIELGAGVTIQNVRRFGMRQNAPMIRINTRDCESNDSRILDIPMGALAALEAINQALPYIGQSPFNQKGNK